MALFTARTIHRIGSRFNHPIRLLVVQAAILAAVPAAAATIVLDPGHGGIERGALSAGDISEKQFTLLLARKIADRLALKHRVTLTREDDISMSPDDRAGVANHMQADLMVSLHVGVPPYCGERSAAIHYHDDERLTMPAAGGIQDALDRPPSDQPAWNHLQMQHQARSRKSAQWIRQALEASDAFDIVTIFPGPLVALMGADMPAVLLEVGCILPKVPIDAKTLDGQLDGYAEAIAAAIDMSLEERLR